MNIVSIDKTEWLVAPGWTGWDLLAPSFFIVPTMKYDLPIYVVQNGEDMRLDLVMMSIYESSSYLEHMDVILYINDIDNPLNIRAGMSLYFPPAADLDSYRYYDNNDPIVSKSIKQSLGVLNKTTRKDEKRKKFLDADYSLPPTVMRESKPPVSISNGKIIVGGI